MSFRSSRSAVSSVEPVMTFAYIRAHILLIWLQKLVSRFVVLVRQSNISLC